MHKKYISISLLLLAVVALIRWGIVSRGEMPHDEQKLQVAASFYPLYFLADEIAGDVAHVFTIIPAGAEPHEYEPSAQDIARMYESDMLIVNGAGIEPWLEDVSKNIDTERTAIIVAGEPLATERMIEEGEEVADPHVWLDPVLVQEMVSRIADGFVSRDPDRGALYLANAEALRAKLASLDVDYRRELSMCEQHTIVTSHAAFGYLALRYGFDQIAVTGVSPEAEPSSQELGEIVDFVKENGIKYIFFETLVSPKLAQVLAKEAGADTLVLNPLEGLTANELTSGKNYLTEMRANLKNLKIALECI